MRQIAQGLMAAVLLIVTGLAVARTVAAAATDTSVLELRQYKIVQGKWDEFAALFEQNFVDTQEAEGMRMPGQFRNLDDPNRFTWLREFPNMSARAKSLTAFYYGPVWKAHRDEANPLLDDNDNVLLLRPATPDLRLAVAQKPRARIGERPSDAGLVIVTIYYLWKDPADGFTQFFAHTLRPALQNSGMPVLGGYVAETTPNNFPRLPVRQSEKVFVWFSRFTNERAFAQAQTELVADATWSKNLAKQLALYEERQPQVLRLVPTPRSEMR